jgi:MFS family permease
MATRRDRLMPLGSALTGLGGALAIGYLIYSLQDSSRSFWRWPGILGLVVLCVGVFVLIAGFLAPTTKSDAVETRPQIRQKQSGGRRSTNYQAGGDIAVGQVDKKKK